MSNQKVRSYSREFKLEAVKLVIEQNYSIREAAENLGVGKSTMAKWVNAYKSEQDPLAAFPGKGNLKPTDAAYKQLENELIKVRRERDILKKALGYFAKPQE